MGVAATLAPKGPGPQDPTKKLAHRMEHLGQRLSQKKVFITSDRKVIQVQLRPKVLGNSDNMFQFSRN